MGWRAGSLAAAACLLALGCEAEVSGGGWALVPRAEAPATTCARGPAGQRRAMKADASDAAGPRVDPPFLCEGDPSLGTAAAITVHGRGSRRFEWNRASASACDVPDADSSRCPTVAPLVFARATAAVLAREIGPATTGYGETVCVQPGVDRGRTVSAHVYDWRRADAAIEILDRELLRWDVGDEFELSVMAAPCAPAVAPR